METTDCTKVYDPEYMTYKFTSIDEFYCSYNYDHSTKTISNFQSLERCYLTKFLYEFEHDLDLKQMLHPEHYEHNFVGKDEYEEKLKLIGAIEIDQYQINFKNSLNEIIYSLPIKNGFIVNFYTNVIKQYIKYLETLNKRRNIKSARF